MTEAAPPKTRRREPRPPPPPPVDFSFVPPSQWKMHDRLENWARAQRGTTNRIETAPGFELYRSSDAKREYGAGTVVPVDKGDAHMIKVGMDFLPEKNRRAIDWCYLHGKSAGTMASDLGVSKQGLLDLIVEGRQMLINRGV